MTATHGLPANPSLESQLSTELMELVRGIPIGAEFSVAPSAKFCSSLELYLPRLLRARYPEWASERRTARSDRRSSESQGGQHSLRCLTQRQD